jgi:hypothetical protein
LDNIEYQSCWMIRNLQSGGYVILPTEMDERTGESKTFALSGLRTHSRLQISGVQTQLVNHVGLAG